jgi:hypothetical protein
MRLIVVQLAHSSSGPGRRPLKAETRGSNPLCAIHFRPVGLKPNGAVLCVAKRKTKNLAVDTISARFLSFALESLFAQGDVAAWVILNVTCRRRYFGEGQSVCDCIRRRFFVGKELPFALIDPLPK